MREVLIDIGVNGAFLTRRWETPETFMALTRETGYTYHEFCGDVIDPFFSLIFPLRIRSMISCVWCTTS